MAKQIVFAYIDSIRKRKPGKETQGVDIEDLNLNFCPEVNIHYDKESKTLSISNQTFPENFYPEGVATVAAIVGGNGCGKTSIINWLMSRLVSGYDAGKLGGIIAVRDRSQITIYYDLEIINQDEIKSDSVLFHELKEERVNHHISIPLAFQTNCFDILRSDSPTDYEWTGEINISDKYLLVHDLQAYANVDTLHSTRQFYEHINAYYTQNGLRICLLVLDHNFRNTIEEKALKTDGALDLKLPPYVIFRPNTSAERNASSRYSSLTEKRNSIRPDDKDRPYDKEGIDSTDDDKEWAYLQKVTSIHRKRIPENHDEKFEGINPFVNSSLISFFYNLRNLQNFPYELKKGLLDQVSRDYSLTTLSDLEWIEYITKQAIDPIDDANLAEFCRNFFDGLQKVVVFLYEKVAWKEKIPYLMNDMVSTHPHILKDLVELMKNPAFLTERFFDLHYSHDLERESILSGGELSLLNLFSRIREAWTHQISSAENYITPTLLLLDEVEVGYHPEWQRRFINELLGFLSCLANKDNPVQIIYTTHSPITLSDMPKHCVNMIDILDKKSVVIDNEDKPGVFGANIFTIYGESFFMRNGLIGEFAIRKLYDISNKIEGYIKEKKIPNAEAFKNLKMQIEMIGDVRIKSFLYSRLERVSPQIEIQLLEERLNVLKNISND